jgi:hypothetical protein
VLSLAVVLVLQIALACAASYEGLTGGRPFLDAQDPRVLEILDKNGLSLGGALGRPDAKTNQELFETSPVFRSIVEHVESDVQFARNDSQTRGKVLVTEPIDGVGRVLDLRWLRSPQAQFQLIGIVNRLDRRDFLHGDGRNQSCGEIRVIYRLAYHVEPGWFARLSGTKASASRMPFNLSLIYDLQPRDRADCSSVVKAFVPKTDILPPSEIAAWLLANPLQAKMLRQIELNAQIVRMPSEMEPEFGGQAMYLMRVFGIRNVNGILAAAPKALENTPHLGTLRSDESLRQELIAYIEANASNIRNGVYQIPDKFLDTKVISISTSGSFRKDNHLFTSLFDTRDLRLLQRIVPNVPSDDILERLDTGTCAGCHQGNATAGFHFIGFDRSGVQRNNRVKQAASPHYYAEAKRRAAYMDSLAEGRTPNRFRPLPSAPAARWHRDREPEYESAGLGMPCPLIKQGPAYWTCGLGTTCQAVIRNDKLPSTMGQCLPADRQASAGLSCLSGDIANGPWAFLDRLRLTRLPAGRDAARAICLPPKLGVPGGFYHRPCSEAETSFEGFRNARPSEICGLGGGRSFDLCAASGDFASCLDKSIVRTMRQTCGGDQFCREDYMCQELPDGLPGSELVKDVGYCSPTYFLFQMRIDGHPRPD